MSASTRGVPTLPVPLLRDAVGRETARLSLRRAAAEVSISPNGLRNFLNGSAPRSATRVKLERWLAGRQRVSRPPNVGQLVRLLNELAGDLSTQQTAALAGDIAGLLAGAYEARRLSPPRWVQDLLRHYRVRGGKAASEVAYRVVPGTWHPSAAAVNLPCEVCAGPLRVVDTWTPTVAAGPRRPTRPRASSAL